MTAQTRLIHVSAEQLLTYEPQLDTIRKGLGRPYDAYLDAAELQIATDLLNRTPPLYIFQLPDPRQLSSCKIFKTLGIIYRAGAKTKEDRHWIMADLYENKYAAALSALQIRMPDGARVQAQRRRLTRA